MRIRERRGGSALEFALLTVVWIPLLLGTASVGAALVRGLETTQVARDAGHMYARGVDFSLAGPQTMLSRLTGQLGALSATGNGVVIFSTLTYVGKYVCRQAGYADASTPPVPTGCNNYRHFVFTHRWTVGNRSLRSSKVGDPTRGVNASTGIIPLNDYVIRTENRADRFTLLPAPLEDGNDGYQAGQPVFLVEVYFSGVENMGGNYAFVLF
jgi:hypothetical protein